MEKEIRLDKYLADMGKGSRAEIKTMIRKGLVSVNGVVEKKPERKIKKEQDQVLLNHLPVTYIDQEYYLLNKPQGVISATEDKHRKTVVDLIADKKRKDLFPVGRLDIDTEGLLLITNDGALAHRLLAPAHHVDKVYEAVCAGHVDSHVIEAFEQGLLLSDGLHCLPAKLEILGFSDLYEGESRETSRIRLTIHEGKFHQVKRMMEEVGCPVLHLKRLSMGPLSLGDLKVGDYRRLTEKEEEVLKNL